MITPASQRGRQIRYHFLSLSLLPRSIIDSCMHVFLQYFNVLHTSIQNCCVLNITFSVFNFNNNKSMHCKTNTMFHYAFNSYIKRLIKCYCIRARVVNSSLWMPPSLGCCWWRLRVATSTHRSCVDATCPPPPPPPPPALRGVSVQHKHHSTQRDLYKYCVTPSGELLKLVSRNFNLKNWPSDLLSGFSTAWLLNRDGNCLLR